ncbi:MAG: DNA-binding protein [Proteobacteria bacterium]|nr:DNA-binding protein [Pseudomonadota bacterium]
MARIGINYQQVSILAQELMASGQQPTVERIRARLKTGSHSTIARYLRDWRVQQEKPLVSKEIPVELIALLKGLWERVMQEAQEKIEIISQNCNHALQQNQDLINNLEGDNDKKKQDLVLLEEKCDVLTQEKLTLDQNLIQLQTQIAALQAKEQGLTIQLADKQSYIETLNQQHQQTQANLEHYRTASLEERQMERLRFEQQQHELRQSLSLLKQENDIQKQQKNDLEILYKQITMTQQATEIEIQTLSLQVETITQELAIANKTLVQYSASEQHWLQQHHTLTIKNHEQVQEIINLNAKNATFSEQIATIKAQLLNTIEENKTLHQTKKILEQEKEQLFNLLWQLKGDLTIKI